MQSGQRLESPAGYTFALNRLRQGARGRLLELMQDSGKVATGVVLALGIADRSTMPADTSRVLRNTGTAHLLAISGLHIGLAAMFGIWLMRPWLAFAMRRFSVANPAVGPVLSGLASGAAYAALAGFGVSTQRALIMLAILALVLLLRRSLLPGRVLLCALACVFLVQPLAIYSAGLWFSFSAVAALLAWFVPRIRKGGWASSLVAAQWAVFAVVTPLTLYWIQTLPVTALPANLVAIPWVSLAVVPLTLAGLVLMGWFEIVSSVSLGLAGSASEVLLVVLTWLDSVSGLVPMLPRPSLPALFLAVVGGLLLLLPRGMPGKWLGLVLWAPLLLPADGRPPNGGLRVDVLDAGQGLAALVSSGNHTVLYDTGPGDGSERSIADSALRPALAGLGRARPDRLLISHGDLDHAGGLGRLRTLWPSIRSFASLRERKSGVARCIDTLFWRRDGFDFRVLHPSSQLPYLGNDSSCVLSIRRPSPGLASVLLPGDVSEAVERRLGRFDLLSHQVLLVPHHGSRTSSSAEFVRRVKPAVAIAATGRGNRFGFPHDEVRQRYLDSGAEFWSTGSCGGISLMLHPDGRIEARSARRRRPAPWRFPAGENCP